MQTGDVLVSGRRKPGPLSELASLRQARQIPSRRLDPSRLGRLHGPKSTRPASKLVAGLPPRGRCRSSSVARRASSGRPSPPLLIGRSRLSSGRLRCRSSLPVARAAPPSGRLRSVHSSLIGRSRCASHPVGFAAAPGHTRSCRDAPPAIDARRPRAIDRGRAGRGDRPGGRRARLTVVGQVVPLIGGAVLATVVVPLAVVAARHRLRAVVTGAIAASVVGFLVIGTAAFTAMGACAALGALVGAGDRRGWSPRRTTVIGLAGAMARRHRHHRLALFRVSPDPPAARADQIRNGVSRLLPSGAQTLPVRLARPGRSDREWAVRDWWISLPITLFLVTWFGIWLAIGLSTPALQRVRWRIARRRGRLVDTDASARRLNCRR